MQTDHHDSGRLIQIQWLVIATKQLRKFVIEDFYNLLARRNRSQDLLAQSLRLDLGDKLLRNLVMNVRLKQRQANLSQRVVYVCLRDRAVTPEILKNILKFVGKLREHGYAPLTAACFPAAGTVESTVKSQRVSTFCPSAVAVKMTVYVLGTRFCVNS